MFFAPNRFFLRSIKFSFGSLYNFVSRSQTTRLDSKLVDIKFEIKDKLGFAKFLDEIDFWKRDGLINVKTNKPFTANKLEIILTHSSDINNPMVQVDDINKVTWSMVAIKINEKNEVTIFVFRKDWDEYVFNLLINETL